MEKYYVVFGKYYKSNEAISTVIVTRLTKVIRIIVLKNKIYFKFIGKYLPTNLISVFSGFYIGGNLSPMLGLCITRIYTLNQSLFCLFFIGFFEFINWYFLRQSQKNELVKTAGKCVLKWLLLG